MIRIPATFVRNIRWQYVANLGTGLLGGVYMLLLGNELGLRGFGAFALFTAVATLVFNCLDLRLQEAVVRFVALPQHAEESADDGSTIVALFLLDTGGRLLAFLLVVVLGQPISNVFFGGIETGAEVAAVGVLLLLTKAANAPAVGLLRICDRFDLNARLQLIDWTGRLGVTALIAQFADLGIVAIVSIAAVIGGAINLITVKMALTTWQRDAHRPISFNRQHGWAKLMEMRRFVLASNGISLCDSVVRELDTTIVAWHLGLESTAIYRMTKNFVQVLWRAADPVFLVIMPEIRRFLLEGRQGELVAFLRHVTLMLLTVATVAVISSAALAPWLVGAFLDDRFSAVGTLFPWMSWWIVVSLPLIWTHALASASGVPHLQLMANIAGNLVAAALLFALTPHWGVQGAALGWSTGLAATFVLSLVLLMRARLVSAPT